MACACRQDHGMLAAMLLGVPGLVFSMGVVTHGMVAPHIPSIRAPRAFLKLLERLSRFIPLTHPWYAYIWRLCCFYNVHAHICLCTTGYKYRWQRYKSVTKRTLEFIESTYLSATWRASGRPRRTWVPHTGACCVVPTHRRYLATHAWLVAGTHHWARI